MAIKKRTLYDGFTYDADDVKCEYCRKTPEETEIQKSYASDTYICGDINCWNEYCLNWVWTGDVVEMEEEEYEVCDWCEEEIDTLVLEDGHSKYFKDDGCICVDKEESK